MWNIVSCITRAIIQQYCTCHKFLGKETLFGLRIRIIVTETVTLILICIFRGTKNQKQDIPVLSQFSSLYCISLRVRACVGVPIRVRPCPSVSVRMSVSLRPCHSVSSSVRSCPSVSVRACPYPYPSVTVYSSVRVRVCPFVCPCPRPSVRPPVSVSA